MKSKSYLKHIHFDSARRFDSFGFFLLVIGLLVLGISISNNLQHIGLLAKANAEINNIQDRTVNKKVNKVVIDDPQKIELIDKIKKQISYPWELFFSTLETIHTSEISLMSIQPNIDKKEVLISAEATNTHQMLEYIRVLETQKSIDHVELLSQEAVADNQQERLNFVMMVKLL
jgi:hypothetical protein